MIRAYYKLFFISFPFFLLVLNSIFHRCSFCSKENSWAILRNTLKMLLLYYVVQNIVFKCIRDKKKLKQHWYDIHIFFLKMVDSVMVYYYGMWKYSHLLEKCAYLSSHSTVLLAYWILTSVFHQPFCNPYAHGYRIQIQCQDGGGREYSKSEMVSVLYFFLIRDLHVCHLQRTYQLRWEKSRKLWI